MGNGLKRFVLATGAGVGVSALLFLLMHTLISGGHEFARGELTGGLVDFIRIRKDETVQRRDRRRPQEPEPPEEPPPPPQLQIIAESPRAPVAMFDIGVPRIAVSISTGGVPLIGQWSPGDLASQGDVVPIVRTDPQWPREALIERTGGWVEVEFTILPDGSVENPVVTDSEPPRLFDRSARRAILRWKFKPRIVDGEAVARRATQRIDFVFNQ